MIAFLRGHLAGVAGEQVFLDVHGVGYQVHATRRLLAALPAQGQELTVYTHLQHREDQMQLYGFPAAEDRELFGLLLGVSGVGPRLALNLLGHLSVADLVTAVLGGGTASLKGIPGVGEKTAQRMILELKEKMRDWRHLAAVAPGGDGPDLSALADAEAALLALGFTPSEALEALRVAQGQAGKKATVEDTIRAALLWLSEKR